MIENKDIIEKLLCSILSDTFEIRFWDDTVKTYGSGEVKFTIIFNENISIAHVLENPSLVLGEAYMDKKIDLDGSIEAFIMSVYKNKAKFPHFKGIHLDAIRNAAHSLKSSSSANIEHHYDIGNDFYKLWLDKNMIYSCAYFRDNFDSLDMAQENKLEYILKKLNLSEGQSLLDIGCGWGQLIIKAAKKYKVKALGVTLSREQYEKVQYRIIEEGLEDRVSVMLCDYRNLKDMSFDRIVSVGMIEHVGKHHLSEYFSRVNDLLNDQGLSLLHCITAKKHGCSNSWIEKYIFPGGYVPAIKDIVRYISEEDFEIIDIENLRYHYAKTLELWLQNFDRNIETIRETKDERFIRMWRLYLGSCAAAFKSSNITIHQFVFTKGINNHLPWTRDYLY